jgi:hypothetical protein
VKRLNHRRVKLHRNYLVEEVAMVLKVHKNTVRHWLKSGLKAVDDRRPTLILGRVLAAFLHARRKHLRQPCRPGQLYCLRCRAPKAPTLRQVDYVPTSEHAGNLRGTCEDCGARMCRRVSWRRLVTSAGELEVALPQALQRIEDTASPSLNSDLRRDPHAYANAQSGK